MTGSSTAHIGKLFALAKKLDLNKCEATVIAPREVLEFRALTVPRGDADEVPTWCDSKRSGRWQHRGHLALDYILLARQPGSEGISALAATISLLIWLRLKPLLGLGYAADARVSATG